MDIFYYLCTMYQGVLSDDYLVDEDEGIFNEGDDHRPVSWHWAGVYA